MTKPLYSDPVVAEIHAIRQQLLDDCGGDVAEFRRRIRDRQAASGHEVVSGPLEKSTEQSDATERPKKHFGDGESTPAVH